jgi:hypothetical protein
MCEPSYHKAVLLKLGISYGIHTYVTMCEPSHHKAVLYVITHKAVLYVITHKAVLYVNTHKLFLFKSVPAGRPDEIATFPPREAQPP